jgi:hypothetical protein
MMERVFRMQAVAQQGLRQRMVGDTILTGQPWAYHALRFALALSCAFAKSFRGSLASR